LPPAFNSAILFPAKPEWRNRETQGTQNPSELCSVRVRPPPPAKKIPPRGARGAVLTKTPPKPLSQTGPAARGVASQTYRLEAATQRLPRDGQPLRDDRDPRGRRDVT
jgi:hypothetical protein